MEKPRRTGKPTQPFDKAKPTEFQKDTAEFIAIQEAIASRTVGILTHEGQNAGTGVLIRFKKLRVILTAYHVLEVTPIPRARFAFRPSGSLEVAQIRSFGATRTPLLAGQTIDPLRVNSDRKSDLTAVVLRPEYPLNEPASFYDASTVKDFQLKDGDSLLYSGFPMDNAVPAGPNVEALGMVAEHFHYDAGLNSSEQLTKFDSKRQIALSYSWANDLLPDGFSGSAVWCLKTPSSGIWTPNLVLAGIVTDYSKIDQAIYATKLDSVLRLLSRL